MLRKIRHSQSGFTIIELIVVISIIVILAVIGIVSYGAWRKSVNETQVKAELNAASSAMQAAANFGSGFPISIPDSYQPSGDVTITLALAEATTFCIDGVFSSDSTIQFYLYSKTKEQGPQPGQCADRPDLTPPEAPTGLAMTVSSGTSVDLSWSAVADAASYTAQCASDAAFIVGVKQVTVAATLGTVSGSVTGLTSSSIFYCRVKTVNSKDTSAWSATVSGSASLAYGSLAPGTSVEGYWTTPPAGFLPEDGRAVSRTTYAALFAVIGTTYGLGDGSTTFNLPNSKGRTPVNRNVSDVEFAAIGQLTGSKTEVVTIAQMAAHSHEIDMKSAGAATYGEIAKGDASATGSPIGVEGAIQSRGDGGAHNNIQPSIVKSFVIKYAPIDTAAETLPAGTSVGGYWTSAPAGMLLEDGSAVSRSTYADLFAAIGTTYGAGNGSTTFNLPDSRGRATVNKSATDTEFDTMGEKYGEKTHILTLAEIPAHTHPIRIKNATAGTAATYSEMGGGDSSGGTGGRTPAPVQNTGGNMPHNEIQPSIVQLYAIKFTPASTGTSSTVAPGTSIDGYWAAAPSGYLVENGSAVSRSTYANLFAAIGTTYGAGDGSTTFNLPDSRGRVAVNKSTSDSEFDALGEKFGTKTHTLTIAEMPAHTHPIRVKNAGNATFGETGGGDASGTGIVSANLAQSAGGGGAHNNIQPSIVKLTVIKF